MNNLVGELKIMKELCIKPNFSDLQRKYDIDRHTIKKIYDNGGIMERKKRELGSKWDIHLEEIRNIMDKPGTSKMAAYRYLENKFKKLPGNYNSFKAYTLKKGITCLKTQKAHVLYENDPGELLQFDWKEDLKITLKNGEKVDFNVFSATLGFSREHVFIFSYNKGLNDFIRCFIHSVYKLGGTPRRALTDNMTAIVSIRDNKRNVNTRVLQLMKDLNIELKLARVKTPETKGKVENSNKFMSWLAPYDHELNSVDELIDTIENVITRQCNSQINQGTKIPPAVLFAKEKEYLSPIYNRNLMNEYLVEHHRQEVPSTLLIYHKGQRYSVPKKYIGKMVDIYPIGDKLYIYHNSRLLVIHNITQNRINYDVEHYKEALKDNVGNKCDIEKMALDNLHKLAKLGGREI